jgi:molybdopterin-guanine dinucleotide biosynthesis protein B
MHELRGAAEPGFEDLVAHVAPCDLLLVEGFKREKLSKLEVYRESVGEPLIHPHDPDVVAVASDARVETRLPQFDLNDPPRIAEFMLRHVGLS